MPKFSRFSQAMLEGCQWSDQCLIYGFHAQPSTALNVLDNVCLFGNTYEHYSFPLHCLSIQDSNKTEDCLYVCTSHNDANPYINR